MIVVKVMQATEKKISEGYGVKFQIRHCIEVFLTVIVRSLILNIIIEYRYKWSKDEKEAEMLQRLMQQHVMLEGTEKERELDRKAESA